MYIHIYIYSRDIVYCFCRHNFDLGGHFGLAVAFQVKKEVALCGVSVFQSVLSRIQCYFSAHLPTIVLISCRSLFSLSPAISRSLTRQFEILFSMM